MSAVVVEVRIRLLARCKQQGGFGQIDGAGRVRHHRFQLRERRNVLLRFGHAPDCPICTNVTTRRTLPAARAWRMTRFSSVWLAARPSR